LWVKLGRNLEDYQQIVHIDSTLANIQYISFSGSLLSETELETNVAILLQTCSVSSYYMYFISSLKSVIHLLVCINGICKPQAFSKIFYDYNYNQSINKKSKIII
jgi:hypothetical protein